MLQRAIAVAVSLSGAGVAGAAAPVPIGPPIVVNPDQDYPGAQMSEVAGGPGGEFVVTWQMNESYEPTEEAYPIFARGFDAAGTPLSDVELVNVPNDPNEFERSFYPSIASNAAGQFVVVWNQSRDSATYFYGISGRRLDATGVPQGGEFEVSQDMLYYHDAPQVAATPAGDFVVVWQDFGGYPFYATSKYDVHGRRLDATGIPSGAPFPVKVGSAEDYFRPEVATGPGGAFTVVWGHDKSDPELRAQRFDASNVPVGAELTVSTDAYIDSYPFLFTPGGADVASNASGEFVVAWEADDSSAILARRYDASGTLVGPELTLTTGGERVNLAVEDDGSFMAVWEHDAGNDIEARYFSAGSASLGPVLSVAPMTTFDVRPAVATTGPGRFVVTYGNEDAFDYHLLAQRFALPVDAGITATKLVVVDKMALAGKAKVVFVARGDAGILKGGAGDPANLSGTLDVFYTDAPGSVAGSFLMPSPWQKNTDTVARYVNTLAPDGGPGVVKVGLLKNGVAAKMRAKGLGDGPALDLFVGPPSASGGVTTVFTVSNANDGTTRRMCTRFASDDGSTVVYTELANGAARKLIANNGVATACP